MSETRVTGRVAVHTRGFGFLDVESRDPKISAFVSPPDMNPFLEGDRVAASVEEIDGGRFTATKLTLLERTRRELFGSVTIRNKRTFLRVDRQVSNTDWPLEGEGVAGLAEGTLLVAEIRGSALVPVRHVAPHDASLERVVVRHGIRAEFPAECVDDAAKCVLPGPEGRRDLRDLPTVTIDAPVSRDLDDALAVLPGAPDGGVRLFVSIADVDALVPEGSALDDEARLRATSVYLAGRVIPMLPHALSEEALSLLPGASRPALTVELRIDSEGAVTSVDVYASTIKSHARLSYDAVAAFLDRGDASEVPEAVRETLRWLRTAAARISAVRRARGGVTLLREEAYVTLDESTREPTHVDARPNTSAHLLVERLMVAANEAVARWLTERGLPGVFRVHDEPDAERLASLAASARKFGFEAGFAPTLTPRGLAAFEAQFAETSVAASMATVMARVLGPARYTVFPSLHFGLAAPLYLHFTSPIRRYSDLAVHRIVKEYLAGKRDRFAGESALEELSQHINRQAYRATKAEAERLRTLAARLFATRVGEGFDGNVVAVKPFGLVVQLEGTGITGTVATDALTGGPYRYDVATEALVSRDRTYAIGEHIEVSVAGANEELGRIDLVPRETVA